ncbi:hypothetical protein ACFLU8_04465 [Chloroflexota bacterium]
MVQCKLCGKVVRTTQGLRGHKTFVHNERTSSSTPATETATMQQASNLEDRLDKLEYVTGLREPSILDKYLYDEKPITIQLTEITEQLNSLDQKVTSLPGNTEHREIKNQVTQLAQQLNEANKWFSPVYPEADTISHFEHELSNRAENVRVNALENRLAQLEEEQKEAAGNVNKCMRDNKAVGDIQVEKVMEVIGHVVDKLATSVKQLQSQLSEQKQVTDWVKKEYNLRPVKRTN